MDQIVADINSNQAQECLNTAKKLIQDNIQTITPENQAQLSNIYSLLTPENAKEYLKTVKHILHEIFRQNMRDSGIIFFKISVVIGCGSFLAYFFSKFTGYGSRNIIAFSRGLAISGGIVSFICGWVGFCSYFNIRV